mmetsp:Transcript_43145/g.73579  ORF Transcript_43145/g.73579 Transcript_43145/m.73579 type:complete len:234 (-) Transcript_43145:35-736(-)
MKQLKLNMEETRQTVEELTELADALLFGGEANSYDLTRKDWIHRFKLERYFPSSSQQKKRPLEEDAMGNEVQQQQQAKKKSRGYFDDGASSPNANDGNNGDTTEATKIAPLSAQVMWEYKGNEDGAIHGPYTSKQMHDWTSCGYFVGESAVDIRRVRSCSDNKSSEKDAAAQQGGDDGDAKTDVDDLMADLMDDDDDDDANEGDGKTQTKDEGKTGGESPWMRSDRVDFSLYL